MHVLDRSVSQGSDAAGVIPAVVGACRIAPRGDAPIQDMHKSRLWLNNATQQVLANGLDLLGVSAPTRM